MLIDGGLLTFVLFRLYGRPMLYYNHGGAWFLDLLLVIYSYVDFIYILEDVCVLGGGGGPRPWFIWIC